MKPLLDFILFNDMVFDGPRSNMLSCLCLVQLPGCCMLLLVCFCINVGTVGARDFLSCLALADEEREGRRKYTQRKTKETEGNEERDIQREGGKKDVQREQG